MRAKAPKISSSTIRSAANFISASASRCDGGACRRHPDPAATGEGSHRNSSVTQSLECDLRFDWEIPHSVRDDTARSQRQIGTLFSGSTVSLIFSKPHFAKTRVEALVSASV